MAQKKHKVLFLYPNLSLMQIIPAGITSLSAYLKSKGIEVDLFDTTFYKQGEKSSDEERVDNCQVRPFNFKSSGVEYKTTDMLSDFYDKVDSFNPDVLAISSNDFTHNIANELITEFKNIYPNIRVISGGIYPTFTPDDAISNKNVDAICIGEGFGALYEYVTQPENYGIKNLWIKEKDDIIWKNDIREPISIDEIPYDDFSIFEDKRFYRPMQGKMLKMLPTWIDLGCPYACTYCIAPTIRKLYSDSGHKYNRFKSVDRIMSELHHQITKYSPEYLYISTENFFSRPKEHIIEFAERYAKEIHLPFWCESRVETLTDENVKLLKKMGCDRISLGLEAGNEEYRIGFLKKTFTNKQFYDAIGILNKNKLNCTVNNIIGLPEQDRKGIYDTIHVNRLIVNTYTNIDITLTVSTFVPCGGSGLQKYCIDKGYFDLNKYLKLKAGSFHKGAYLTQPSISQEEILGLLRTFPLYVRLPWDISMLHAINSAEKFTQHGNRVFEKLRDIYWQGFDRKTK